MSRTVQPDAHVAENRKWGELALRVSAIQLRVSAIELRVSAIKLRISAILGPLQRNRREILSFSRNPGY